ncbi:MAG: hypothetical protein OHK005_00740 [Candidatus Methylacidiphilales bacterium]
MRLVKQLLWNWAKAAVAVAMGVVWMGCDEDLRPPPPNIIPMPGPRLVLPSLSGEEVNAEEWRGDWVLLNFFARWSPGTIKEIPDLIALDEEFAGEGVRVVGISVDEVKGPVLQGFVERMGIRYPVLIGSIETGNDFGGLDSIPTTFILDRDWNVINRHTGQISKDAVRRELRALLAEEARLAEQKAAREAAKATLR